MRYFAMRHSTPLPNDRPYNAIHQIKKQNEIAALVNLGECELNCPVVILGWDALVHSGLVLALLFFYEILFGHLTLIRRAYLLRW